MSNLGYLGTVLEGVVRLAGLFRPYSHDSLLCVTVLLVVEARFTKVEIIYTLSKSSV